MATQIKLDSTGWTLNVLAYGEQSPMEDHPGFGIASDDARKELWIGEVAMRLHGQIDITNTCIAYANRVNKRATQ